MEGGKFYRIYRLYYIAFVLSKCLEHWKIHHLWMIFPFKRSSPSYLWFPEGNECPEIQFSPGFHPGRLFYTRNLPRKFVVGSVAVEPKDPDQDYQHPVLNLISLRPERDGEGHRNGIPGIPMIQSIAVAKKMNTWDDIHNCDNQKTWYSHDSILYVILVMAGPSVVLRVFMCQSYPDVWVRCDRYWVQSAAQWASRHFLAIVLRHKVMVSVGVVAHLSVDIIHGDLFWAFAGFKQQQKTKVEWYPLHPATCWVLHAIGPESIRQISMPFGAGWKT